MLHREKIITELSRNYLSVRFCLAAYIMRRGKKFVSVWQYFVGLMQCKKKKLEATLFWRSDICIYDCGVTTQGWFWSPFLIICCAEKKSDAIILLKSWKQSKRILGQYRWPTVPKAAGQYKTLHFYLQCLAQHSIALSHITSMLLFSMLEGDCDVKMW